MEVTRPVGATPIWRALKVVAWIAAGLVGLCVAIYLIIVAVNWRDREPSAAAVRMADLYRDRPAVPDEDNAFIYVLGFSVAPPESPYQMGLKRFAWLQEPNPTATAPTTRDPLGQPVDYKTHRPAAVRNFLTACMNGNPDCANAFVSADGVFEQWMASEDWLLPRYRELIHYHGWRESGPFKVFDPLPPYGLVVDGQRLLLLNAQVLAKRGDYAGVRDLLEEDSTFWRHVLESSDILISRMIATAAVTRDFELGSLVLRNVPSAHVKEALPTAWSRPFSESELSMLRCLVGEWMYISGPVHNADESLQALSPDSILPRTMKWLSKPLYQPQDFMNRYAAYFLEVARLLSVPPDRFESAVNQAETFAQRTNSENFPPRSPYNVMGQILMGMDAANDYGKYARRVEDLEGIRRAVLLAANLRAAGVKADDVSAALKTNTLREPYHNTPFEWDEKGSDIVFHGLELADRSVHRIFY